MAVAHVTEFEIERDDRSLAHYDAVTERVRVDRERPPGLIVHAAGFTTDGVFRIIDVWETEEQAQRFHNERLGPILEALEVHLAAPARQRFHSYGLHHVVY
jgi:hypothetical protein